MPLHNHALFFGKVKNEELGSFVLTESTAGLYFTALMHLDQPLGSGAHRREAIDRLHEIRIGWLKSADQYPYMMSQ